MPISAIIDRKIDKPKIYLSTNIYFTMAEKHLRRQNIYLEREETRKYI